MQQGGKELASSDFGALHSGTILDEKDKTVVLILDA